jgi:hypothetical protein
MGGVEGRQATRPCQEVLCIEALQYVSVLKVEAYRVILLTAIVKSWLVSVCARCRVTESLRARAEAHMRF